MNISSNASITEPDIIVNIINSVRSNDTGIVILSFSQPVDTSDATNISNYQFDSDVTVTSATINGDNTQVTLTLTLLSNVASHQLTLGEIHTVATTKNASLGVVLDTLPPEAIINDDDTSISYEAYSGWSNDDNREYCYNNDAHETTGNNSWATMNFIGTGISYYSEINKDQGNAEVFIDDVSIGVFSTYSDDHENSRIICSALNLEFGVHAFKLVKVDGTWVRLDALKIYNDGEIEVASYTNGPGKTFILKFNQSLDKVSAENISNYVIDNNGTVVSAMLSGANNDMVTLTVDNVSKNIVYKIIINQLSNQIQTKTSTVITTVSLLTDDELCDLVQKTTFKMFWDYANPISGMAYKFLPAGSNTPGVTVTTGSNGFGIMSMLVASERGFISKNDALNKITTIVNFLTNNAIRYKGAWAHWMNGDTGATIPFSQDQTGGDIVETSYMIMGLLCARQYFSEQALTDKINTLWQEVEWDYFTFGTGALYWNIDANLNPVGTMTVTGWNEAMITYILAISSPTHAISPDLWISGWSQGSYNNKNQTYYNVTVPVGPSYTGSLFFGQYTFQGFDPRNLLDSKNNVDYLMQNQAQAQVHNQHGIINPNGFTGYGDNCWGLTASDGPSDGSDGYSAFSPTNDNGTIAPTGALSAMPWLPEKSIKAMRHYYDDLGLNIWTDKCGFIDSFNLSRNWYDSGSLALDQAPIINMIENYRSQLLWKLFMSCPEVQSGLALIGFTQK